MFYLDPRYPYFHKSVIFLKKKGMFTAFIPIEMNPDTIMRKLTWMTKPAELR